MNTIISKWLEGHTIDLNSVQCLNNQSRQDVCEKCINDCPTNALQLEDNNIALSKSSCLKCGRCVSDCPVLAVDYSSKPYTKTIKQITSYPNSSITCEQFDKYQKGIKVPCYLHLDTAMLTHYVTVSKNLRKDEENNFIVELYLGSCGECPLREHFSVQEHIYQLQGWFDHVGFPIKLIGTSNDKNYMFRDDEEAADGITRRTLLKSFTFNFFGKTQEQEAELKDTSADELDTKEKKLYKRDLINLGFSLFHNQIEKNQKELPASDFAMVKKKEPCTKCTICEKICPTDALIWEDTKDISSLYFYPQKCIACRRCEECPMKSISVHPITASDYINIEKKQISNLQIGKCTDCGDNFMKTEESQELCSICRKKGKVTRSLFDRL